MPLEAGAVYRALRRPSSASRGRGRHRRLDWTAGRPPSALAGSGESAVVYDERPGSTQSSGSSCVSSEAGRGRGAGQGVSGASGLALGTLVVSKPHMLPFFTEGGCHQQGRGGSAGQNH